MYGFNIHVSNTQIINYILHPFNVDLIITINNFVRILFQYNIETSKFSYL